MEEGGSKEAVVVREKAVLKRQVAEEAVSLGQEGSLEEEVEGEEEA